MKKLALILALVMTMMCCLTGCGEQADSQGEGEAAEKVLTMSFWLEPEPEWEAKVLADTGIKIEYEQIDSANYFDIMTTRLQGGTAADIFWAFNTDAATMYGEAGYAIDLTDFEWLNNVNPNVIEAAKVEGGGRVYGVNEVVSYVNCLFYNKDMFEANGIEVPKNMDEFIAVCEQLKALGITPLIHGDADSSDIKRTPFEPICIITATEGGSEWVKGLATGESKFTDDIFVNAAGYLEDAMAKGYLSDLVTGITHVEAWELFANGEAAMMTGASFYADQNWAMLTPEFEVGLAACPYNFEGEPKLLAATAGSTIMANANSENQEVIMEYLEYFFTHWPEYTLITGRPMAYVGEGGDWAPYAWMFEEWSTYECLPYTRETSLIQKDLEAYTQGLLVGNSVQDDLADLQSRLEAAIQ